MPIDIAVAHSTTPYVSAYPWTPTVGFGVKYADPLTKPIGTGYGVAFCGNTDIAVVHSGDPYVSAYPWTPTVGFGVKYANPLTKPTGTGRGVAFSFSSTPTPTVTLATPNSARRGETADIVLAGTGLTGATIANFGTLITTNHIHLDSDIQITANIAIASGAALGARNVSVTTPGGTGTLTLGFTVAKSIGAALVQGAYFSRRMSRLGF